MTAVARSLKVFAVYLALLGITLLFAPNALLGIFGLPATSEVWIRVVGMLVLFLAVYYWTAAGTDAVPFFRATVLCRLTVPVFFIAFVVGGWATWPLLLFGVVDAAGAAWTWRTLGHSSATA
jgi:hypothetical protein